MTYFVLEVVDLGNKNEENRVELEIQWGDGECFTVSVPDSVRIKADRSTLVPTGLVRARLGPS